MSLVLELQKLFNIDEEVTSKIENSLKETLTEEQYSKLLNEVSSEVKYLKPTYDYKDFEKQRDMISCILYSTIGQESMDWVNEWSDIPKKMFTGVQPNSYEYEQIKLFVENYYQKLLVDNELKISLEEFHDIKERNWWMITFLIVKLLIDGKISILK